MIHSANNPTIVQLAKIRTSKKMREQLQSVLVFGEKIVGELLEVLEIKRYITMHERVPKNLSREHLFRVSPPLFKKIAGQATFDGVAAEFKMPTSQPFDASSNICVLDRISDPGNMGTLIRSACAFGFKNLFLLPECVDLFNDKVIRASCGGVFKLKWQRGDYHALEKAIKTEIRYVADLEGIAIDQIKKEGQLALLIGNEAEGVSVEGRKWGTRVTVPMSGPMESLNAATAASICMYECCHG